MAGIPTIKPKLRINYLPQSPRRNLHRESGPKPLNRFNAKVPLTFHPHLTNFGSLASSHPIGRSNRGRRMRIRWGTYSPRWSSGFVLQFVFDWGCRGQLILFYSGNLCQSSIVFGGKIMLWQNTFSIKNIIIV